MNSVAYPITFLFLGAQPSEPEPATPTDVPPEASAAEARSEEEATPEEGPGEAGSGTTADPANTGPATAPPMKRVPARHVATLLGRDIAGLTQGTPAPTSTPSREEFTSSRSGALGDTNSVTAPDDFSVAIQTTLEGVEAGVAVSPFALIRNMPIPVHGIHVLVAALKDGKARWGAGYSILVPPRRPLRVSEVGLSHCPVSESDVWATGMAVERDFAAVCETFVAAYAADTTQLASDAREACGFSGSTGDDVTLQTSTAWIGEFIDAKTDPDTNSDVHKLKAAKILQRSIAPHWDALSKFKIDRGLDCWATDKALAKIDEAHRRYEWEQDRHRLGVRFTEDRQAYVLGFNPDETTELPKGEVVGRRALAEYNIQWTRLMVSVTGGYYGGQVPVTDDSAGVHGAEVGGAISVILGALDGQRLVEGGSAARKLRAPKGKLPPHVALGFSSKSVLLTARPDSQESALNDLELLPYFDFVVTDKLNFRVGTPIVAKTVLRSADPAMGVEERRGLQWRVSPLVFTVLKL